MFQSSNSIQNNEKRLNLDDYKTDGSFQNLETLKMTY